MSWMDDKDLMANLGHVLVIIGSLAIIVAGPHVTIWAVNVVSGSHIEHGLREWAATLWLTLTLRTFKWKSSK